MDDFQVAARPLLRSQVYDHMVRGNWNEATRRWNREAFDKIKLYPRYLRDTLEVDTVMEVLGQPIDYPLSIPPFGFSGAMLPEGDLPLARGKSCVQ